jgi:hypothetical protein
MRWTTAVLALGLGAVGVLLATVRPLPLQDLPNLAAVLTLDRGLTPAAAAYLQPHQGAGYGYLLFVWAAELAPRAWSVDVVLRILFTLSALALPLSVARLAAALHGDGDGDGDAALAGIASLPLALSWPLRIGLLSFCLAVPCLLMAIAATVRLYDRCTPARTAALASWAALAYLAHPLVLVLLAPVVLGAAWLGRRRPWRVTALVAATAPSVLLLLLDIARDAFAPLGAMQTAARHPSVYERPLPVAAAHLLTRAFGIDGLALLVACAPFVVVLLLGLRRATGRAPLAWLALGVAVLAALALPDSIGLAFVLGSRLAVVVVALACALAAAHARPRWLALSALLALVAAIVHIGAQSRLVAEVVGSAPPRTLAGRYLPMRVADCAAATTIAWGGDDPLRHVWAYALSPSGVTPYLFAWSRYAPIWFRDRGADGLRAPAEFALDANEAPLEPVGCRAANLSRLRGALAWPGYDGVIAVGRPRDLDPLVGDLGEPLVRVAPGIVVVTPSPTPVARFEVDDPTPAWAAGWYDAESVDGRRIRWSAGARSRVDADFAPREDRAYVLGLAAKAVTDEAVAVRVNGRSIGSVAVGERWRWRAIDVPAAALHHGGNRIELVYSTTRTVDGRRLAIAVGGGELAPAPESVTLDVDRDDDRRLLDEGWSVLERDGGRGVVWSDGPASRIVVALDPSAAPYELVLEAAAYRHALPQTVSVRIDGRDIGAVTLADSWRTATLAVPAGALRRGLNIVELVYARLASPRDVERGSRDARELALRLRSLALRPAARASR